MIKFIEGKRPDFAKIQKLLDLCQTQNKWANKGPLYEMLTAKYTEYFNLSSANAITPCANGGIALEVVARVISAQKNKPIRWVGSTFSFQNLGRGYFSEIEFIDCDEQGLLNLEILEKLPNKSFDGIVLVNPFGMFNDFSKYINFAVKNDKALIIDNAAGINCKVPDWPWQSFSLHHTKPFGFGEGGLALTPSSVSDYFYELINYGEQPRNAIEWLNNGKISDVSCAFLIDRLEQVNSWLPFYNEQEQRIRYLMESTSLEPLNTFNNDIPAMSTPFRAKKSLPLRDLKKSKKIVYGKYYKPLADLPVAKKIYDQLVNIPTHPDMIRLSDNEILEEINTLNL